MVRSALVQRAQKERWAQWNLKQGLQALPEAVEETLRGRERVEVHKSAPVRRLDHTAAGWEVRHTHTATAHCEECFFNSG